MISILNFLHERPITLSLKDIWVNSMRIWANKLFLKQTVYPIHLMKTLCTKLKTMGTFIEEITKPIISPCSRLLSTSWKCLIKANNMLCYQKTCNPDMYIKKSIKISRYRLSMITQMFENLLSATRSWMSRVCAILLLSTCLVMTKWSTHKSSLLARNSRHFIINKSLEKNFHKVPTTPLGWITLRFNLLQDICNHLNHYSKSI